MWQAGRNKVKTDTLSPTTTVRMGYWPASVSEAIRLERNGYIDICDKRVGDGVRAVQAQQNQLWEAQRALATLLRTHE